MGKNNQHLLDRRVTRQPRSIKLLCFQSRRSTASHISVAKELAKRNITVNVVAPGYVATATSEVISDRAREFLLQAIPMGRFGYVEEIVPMVAFLTKEEARYITGDVLRVDGGLAI